MSEATARPATTDDIRVLTALYEQLEAEMVGLKAIWRLTDGLPEPIDAAFLAHLDAPTDNVYVGEYAGVPVGFLVWRREPLLPQAEGADTAVIRLVFTLPEARRVGVGEAMALMFLSEARGQGVELFDAIVPPGHRHAKNFFESLGFKARRIVMHRDDRLEA